MRPPFSSCRRPWKQSHGCHGYFCHGKERWACWAGRFGAGGPCGAFTSGVAGVPQLRTPPHPHRAALTHFSRLMPSPKFALESVWAEAQPQPPPPHTFTRARAHTRTLLPTYSRSSFACENPPNIWESDQVEGTWIGNGAGWGGKARGNGDDGRVGTGFRKPPTPRSPTPPSEKAPRTSCNKRGWQTDPGKERGEVSPPLTGTRPAPGSPPLGVLRAPPPARVREWAGGRDAGLGPGGSCPSVGS